MIKLKDIFFSMRRIISFLTIALILMTKATGQSFVLDMDGYNMSFLEANRTCLVDAGNGGKNAGSVHRYDDLITKDGLTVYGKLTILETNNASIGTYFDYDNPDNGLPGRFQPYITTNVANGYVLYELEFYEVITNQRVYISDYYLTGMDIDGQETYEIGGYSSYEVDGTCGLSISHNSGTARTKFEGISASLAGLTFENTAAFVARYNFPYTKVQFAFGNKTAITNRQFSAQFGTVGGLFTNPYTTWNPKKLISITKTANTNSFKAGTNNKYTIKLENVGGVARHVTLSDILPAGVTYVPNSTSITIPAANVIETVIDHFNLTPVSYSLNNGSVLWASNWIEADDDNSPSAGLIQISTSKLYFNVLNTAAKAIRRGVDLSMAQSATLEFDYNTNNMGAEALVAQLSTDGINYTNISANTDITGTKGSTHFSYTIPNTYFLSTTVLRFISNTGAWTAGQAYIDNIKITYYYTQPAETRTNAPGTLSSGVPPTLLTLADNITLHPNITATLTFDVSTDCNASGTLTNSASATCDDMYTASVEAIHEAGADPTTISAERCGSGNVTLTASGASASQDYKWYDAPSGGNLLQTGGSAVTGSFSFTTTYYVSLYNTTTLCESGRTPVTATINSGAPTSTAVITELTSHNGAVVNTGNTNPAAASNSTSAGTVAWTNPTNVYTSNNARASATNMAENTNSNFLDISGFGFAIPAGNQVKGIEVRIERGAGTANRVYDNVIQLLNNGVPVGNNLFSATAWPTTEGYATYGGPSGLWGTTWTTSDISNIGLRIQARRESTTGAVTANVDHATINVYYAPYGDDQNCVNFGVSGVTGVTSYTWTPPTGGTIVAGQGTNSVFIDFNNAGQSGAYNVCVTPSNDCGAAAQACKTIRITDNANYEISGTVYNDPNGSVAPEKVDGTPVSTIGGQQLYVTLSEGASPGITVFSKEVSEDGTYKFSNLKNTASNYNIIISTSVFGAGTTPSASLPAGSSWAGEINNNSTNSLTGNDGTANGIITALTAGAETNVNFGIMVTNPVANNDEVTINEDNSANINVTTNDIDPDGIDVATVDLDPVTSGRQNTVSNADGNWSVDNSGVVSFIPMADQFGTYSISYTVKDLASYTSNSATVTITVNPVNDEPSFIKGLNQIVNEDAGAQIIPGWAASISKGPSNESLQTVSFALSNDNNSLFSEQPAISSDGTLTYTTAVNGFGSSAVSIVMTDDGGTANGGNNTYATQLFTITVNAVNDAPVITSNGGGASASVSVAENTTVVTTVTATDVDIPAQTLTYTITGGADAAKFSIVAATGVLTFTAAPNYESPTDAGANNIYDVQVTVTDNGTGNLTDVQDIAVTVTNTNDAPVITSNGGGASASVSVAENTTAVTTVTATDVDVPAQTLTYTITGGADAAKFSIVAATGVLTFTAAPNYESPTDASANNIYDVQVTVTDNGTGNLTDVQDIAVTVTNVNEAPVITSNGGGASASVSVTENTTAVTTVTATDVDVPAQTLTYTITGGADAAKFSIVAATGVLTFTAAPNYESPTDASANNIYDVQVTVTDNGTGNLTDVQDIAVTVTNANEAPVITSNGGGASASVSVAENMTAVTTVTATDVDAPTQTLTYTITGGADAAKFSIVAATGVLTFTAAPNYESPTDAGANNIYDVQVTVTDNGTGNLTDVQDIAVTVTNANEAPVVSDISKSLNKNNTLTFAAADFTAAFTDADGNSLTRIQIISLPANGTLKLSGVNVVVTDEIAAANLGNLTFTPNADWFGSTSFGWNGFDGTVNASSQANVNVTVNAVNDAPVVSDVTKSVNEDNILTFAAADFTASFTDADGNSLAKIQITSLPANGTLRLSGVNVVASDEILAASLGNLTFTPKADWNGSTSFGWNGYDGTVYAVAPANVNITVNAVNDAPVVSDVAKSMNEDAILTFAAADFTASFSDADGNSLSKIQITSLPANGIIKLSGVNVVVNDEIAAANLGNLTFTPNADWFGSTSFAWNGFDGTVYASSPANGNITVNPVNDAPDLNDIYLTGLINTTITFTETDFTDGYIDYEDDALAKVKIVTLPANGTLRLSGVDILAQDEILVSDIGNLTFVPATEWNGTTSFTWNGNDGLDYSASDADVYISVSSLLNNPPVVSDFSGNANEDNLLIFAEADFTGNYNDADGNSLTKIQITSLPADGTLKLSGVNVVANDEIPAASLGNLTFTPNADWNGSTSFGWNGFDGNVYASTNATVSITINPVNDPPQILESRTTIFVNEDGGSVYLDVPLNISNDEADVLAITIGDHPKNGTATIDANGILTYTPDENFNGIDSITYQICDNGTPALCASGILIVVVDPVNDPPVLLNDILEFTMIENGGSEILDIRPNIVNYDGDILISNIHTNPKHGIVSINGNGYLVYTPDENFVGTDTIIYEVCDNGIPSLCVNGTVLVYVTSENSIPAISDFTRSTQENQSLMFTSTDFTSNFTDADQDTLIKIQIISLPASGNLILDGIEVIADQEISISDVSKLEYVPEKDYTGEVSFIWKASDGTDYSAEGEAIIQIKPADTFIPGGFSPNGDGINDYFVIKGADKYMVTLSILNRWGNIVFESKQYQNDWNGISNTGLHIGEELPDGTYFYSIDFNNGEKVQVGYITINR